MASAQAKCIFLLNNRKFFIFATLGHFPRKSSENLTISSAWVKQNRNSRKAVTSKTRTSGSPRTRHGKCRPRPPRSERPSTESSSSPRSKSRPPSLEKISVQNYALMSKQNSFRLSCSTKTPDFQNLYLFQGSRLESLERNKFASQKTYIDRKPVRLIELSFRFLELRSPIFKLFCRFMRVN